MYRISDLPEHIELEMALHATHGHGDIVPNDLAADLRMHVWLMAVETPDQSGGCKHCARPLQRVSTNSPFALRKRKQQEKRNATRHTPRG